MNDFVELHAIFSGKVQGVGFRWTVVEYAEKFQLTGTVKNLLNGKVEVIAQGSKNALTSFVEALKKDPGAARIDSVNSSLHKSIKSYQGFQIIQ